MIKKKVAFITGASEGIGKAIALDFAKKGFAIYLLSRSIKKLKKLKDDILNYYHNDHVDIISHDMEKKINKNIDKYCKNKLGLPDILINNSGGPESGMFLNITDKMWERTLNRNLFSIINLTTIFSKYMIKNKWGRIITISSTVAKEPSSGMVQSATVRAAALAFNKSTSFDLAKYGITNNSILLGGIETNRLKKLIKINAKINKMTESKYKNNLLKKIPSARLGKPEEVAALVSFLISDNGEYVSGQSLVIDGGMSKII
jgi:3-oxoacyl-[acyl-carrier protein] reductase